LRHSVYTAFWEPFSNVKIAHKFGEVTRKWVVEYRWDIKHMCF